MIRPISSITVGKLFAGALRFRSLPGCWVEGRHKFCQYLLRARVSIIILNRDRRGKYQKPIELRIVNRDTELVGQRALDHFEPSAAVAGKPELYPGQPDHHRHNPEKRIRRKHSAQEPNSGQPQERSHKAGWLPHQRLPTVLSENEWIGKISTTRS